MTNFRKNKALLRIACLFVTISFLSNAVFPGFARAQDLVLPAPTQFVHLSNSYSFPVLKGLRFDPKTPFNMQFIIDTADQKDVDQEEASRLIKYFFAGLAIPEKDTWVNMSSYEKDRIIPSSLAETDLGKDLLSLDYILKQVSVSLTYPESEIGKDFWAKTYASVLKIAHTTNLPVNTFNKIWIMPDKAEVYEHENFALVHEATLKTMLEEDYIALKNGISDIQKQKKNMKEELIEKINKASSDVMREFILPKINKDVNSGKNFATLRQIYYSLILGVWFKKKFKDSIYKYYINQGKVNGIDITDKDAKDRIYNLYVQALQKGLYNYIKSDYDAGTHRNIKRQYFSGGFTAMNLASSAIITPVSSSAIFAPNNLTGPAKLVAIAGSPIGAGKAKRAESPVDNEDNIINDIKKLVDREISGGDTVNEDITLSLTDAKGIIELKVGEHVSQINLPFFAEVILDRKGSSWMRSFPKGTLKSEMEAALLKEANIAGSPLIKTVDELANFLETDKVFNYVTKDKSNGTQHVYRVKVHTDRDAMHPDLRGRDKKLAIRVSANDSSTEKENSLTHLTEIFISKDVSSVEDALNLLIEKDFHRPLMAEFFNNLQLAKGQAQLALSAGSPMEISKLPRNDLESLVNAARKNREDKLIKSGAYDSLKRDGLMRILSVNDDQYDRYYAKDEGNRNKGVFLDWLSFLVGPILREIRETRPTDQEINEYAKSLYNLLAKTKADLDKNSGQAGSPIRNLSQSGDKNGADRTARLQKIREEIDSFVDKKIRTPSTGNFDLSKGVSLSLSKNEGYIQVKIGTDNPYDVQAPLLSKAISEKSGKDWEKTFPSQTSIGEIKLALLKASGAESPMITAQEKTKELINKLYVKNVNQRFMNMFGLSKEEADKLDPQLSKIGFDGKENRLGWTLNKLKWILENPKTVEAVLRDAEVIRNKYKNVIFCGMGGSGLSVQVVKTTFGERETKIFSLRTTDPAVIADILDEITKRDGSLKKALENTLIIPISKSGTTQETVSHKKYFEDLYKKYNLDIKEHMWVITDKGSPFDTGDFVQREIQLNGKGDIGGRYTAPTTSIFLLPLAIVAPQRVWPILEIAKKMNSVDDINKDEFLKAAAFLYYMAKELGKDKLTLFVPEELKDLPGWFEQLLEESLGKDGKGITLFYGERLSPKVLKPAAESDRVFFRINLGENNKTQEELWSYLSANNYPIGEFNLRNLNDIGGLMLGLQRIVATVAYLWDINFVDQPAVEGYKKATKKVMSELKPGEKINLPQTANSVRYGNLTLYYEPLIKAGILTRTDIEKEVHRYGLNMQNAAAVYMAILNLLERRPAFEAVEIMSYGRMSKDLRETLEEARYKIFTREFKMPSKLGEGPDKNHSFHQNIEGGKDMWLSMYFMPLKIQQPEALEYDENLIKAQTIGTVNSLVDKGRKVILLTMDSTSEQAVSDIKDFFIRAEKYLGISSLPASTGTSSSPTAKFESLKKELASLRETKNLLLNQLQSLKEDSIQKSELTKRILAINDIIKTKEDEIKEAGATTVSSMTKLTLPKFNTVVAAAEEKLNEKIKGVWKTPALDDDYKAALGLLEELKAVGPDLIVEGIFAESVVGLLRWCKIHRRGGTKLKELATNSLPYVVVVTALKDSGDTVASSALTQEEKEKYLNTAKNEVENYLKKQFADKKISEEIFNKAMDVTYKNLEFWATDESIGRLSPETQDAIFEAIQQNRWKDIVEVFRQDITFGTAGIRGKAALTLDELLLLKKDGPSAKILKGPNTINDIVLLRYTTGVIQYTKEKGLHKVVIGYDSRIAGEQFAEMIAQCFIAQSTPEYKFTVYLFDEASPFPELSFGLTTKAVRADLGILISASHNPSEYNGYKVTDSTGSQLPQRMKDEVKAAISKVTTADIKLKALEEAEKGQLIWLGGKEPIRGKDYKGVDVSKPENFIDMHTLHVEQVKKFILDRNVVEKQAKNLSIGFSAFNGSGNKAVPRLLNELDFINVKVIEKLQELDGLFPAFGWGEQPDPGDPISADIAVKEFIAEHGQTAFDKLDILIGTDPDADRMGLIVKVPESQQQIFGKYRLLSANDVWTLLIWYRLMKKQELGLLGDPQKHYITFSHVTTDALEQVAALFGVPSLGEMYDKTGIEERGHHLNGRRTWVGFTYIADFGQKMQVKGFINEGGAEESNGFSILGGPIKEGEVIADDAHVNDKDGTFAGILLAEIASYAKDKNTTIFELLDDIYLRIGHYATANRPLPRVGSFEGAEGITEKINLLKKAQEWMQEANKRANTDDPFMLGGLKVIGAAEFKSGRYDEQHYKGFPDEGVRFFFKDSTLKDSEPFYNSKNYITIRPSGTSQTIRFYTQIYSTVSKEKIAEQKFANYLLAEKLALQAQKELLADVGITKYIPKVDEQLEKLNKNAGSPLTNAESEIDPSLRSLQMRDDNSEAGMPKGGIDLGDINVGATPNSVPVNMPPINLENLQGFTFRIIRIQPISNLAALETLIK